MSISKILINDERIYYYTKLHWNVYTGAILFFIFSYLFYYIIDNIFFARIFLCFGILSFIQSWVNRKSKRFLITNRRVIVLSGLLNIRTLEIHLKKIEGLLVSRPLLGRLLNFGTIYITGTGGIKIPLENIKDPEGFRETIINLQNMELTNL